MPRPEFRPLTVRSDDGTSKQVSPGGTFRIGSTVTLSGVAHRVHTSLAWDGESLALGEVVITREPIPLRELWRMVYEAVGLAVRSSAPARGKVHG
jgi:hypothetical protein